MYNAMISGMGVYGMGFFWLVPLSIVGLLIWLLVSLLKNTSNKQQK